MGPPATVMEQRHSHTPKPMTLNSSSFGKKQQEELLATKMHPSEGVTNTLPPTSMHQC
jgi:hypothetical protein